MTNELAAAARTVKAAYRGLRETAHKQLGVRYAKEALQFAERNPAHAAEMLSRARFHLPYAKEAA